MKSYSNALVKTIWEKIRTTKTLTIFEWTIFVVLFCFSALYRVGFLLSLWVKKYFMPSLKVSGARIISVGNISVGGTGKTVVTHFLVALLKHQTCAVVLRGYQGSNEKTGHSLLVSDGAHILCSPERSGDEAFMLATALHVPIVVGSNRAASCLLLQKLFKPQIIILDDAYQNFQVHKDIQIVLLDARKPFENGYVLPAGPLREKDISRADYIILTHANEIPAHALEVLKKITLRSYNYAKIFSGKHRYDGVYVHNAGPDVSARLKHKHVVALAGIGSVSGFLQTIKDAGMIIDSVIELEDHHSYDYSDLEKLQKALAASGCQAIVTTAKDWAKLGQLVNKFDQFKNCPIYVVRITFEFLSHNEYSSFKEFLEIE